VFSEVREIELDLLDAAARAALDAERRIEAERQRLAATQPAFSQGTRRAWTLSRALALASRTAPRDSSEQRGAWRWLPRAIPRRAGVPRTPLVAAPSLWTELRIWPAAAVWLAIAVVSLPLPRWSGPPPDSISIADSREAGSARITPQPSSAADASLAPSAAPSAATSASLPASPASPIGVAAPFLRIDLTLSSGSLNAILTSPSGMFTGVWSLEIDNDMRRRRAPATGR
jgi:hypothetical protein